MVDLLLRLAVDDKRHGRRELEHRPAVERRHPLTVELELHDRAILTRTRGNPLDIDDPRLREERDVQLNRLPGSVRCTRGME